MSVLFWVAAGLLVYTHVGYPLVLWLLARLKRPRPHPYARELPSVSLIVAAYDEEAVIAGKVRNALELDYPRERLELIVASDGSTDRTVELAGEAGADAGPPPPRARKGQGPDNAGGGGPGGGGGVSGAPRPRAPPAPRA